MCMRTCAYLRREFYYLKLRASKLCLWIFFYNAAHCIAHNFVPTFKFLKNKVLTLNKIRVNWVGSMTSIWTQPKIQEIHIFV